MVTTSLFLGSKKMIATIVTCLAFTYFTPTVSAADSYNCTTPNGENANCISIHNCKLFLSVLKNSDETTRNFLRNSTCGHRLVCCGSDTTFKAKPVLTEKPTHSRWKPLPSRKICGLQHTDDRYYTDTATAIDEFPWLAQLRYKTPNGTSDKCAGSLINRRYVLTAAHCVANSLIKLHNVRLGDYDKFNDTDCAHNPDFPECTDPVIDVNVEEIIVHPKYDPRKIVHDFSLLRLEKNVQFSDFIRPICLPQYGFRNATVGDDLVISGWGRDATTGEVSRTKKRTVNKVVSQEECRKFYENKVLIDKYTICTAEDSNQATCVGDSGGPAMRKEGLQWQQEGVVSFGPRICGTNGSIGGNIRVSEYMDWILDTIRP